MATLSTNSSHRVVPYTHNALVTDRTAAQTSIQAIRDVVHAVRFHVPLENAVTRRDQGVVMMPYVVGIVLSIGVALFAEVGGIRSRSSVLSDRADRDCVVLRAVRGDERLGCRRWSSSRS